MAKTSNSFPQFPDLSPDEVRQLCYIAYFGEDYGSAIPQYIKHFHKSRNTYDETTLKLQNLGYLMTHNTVMPEHHLDVMDFLATEKPEWVNDFKSFRQYSPKHSCEYLWKLAKLLRNDDFEGAASLPKPYEGLGHNLFNVYAYIRNRSVSDPRYVKLLSNEQIYQMTAETLESLLEKGMLDQNAIDSIRQMTFHGHPQYQEMIDRVDLYEFFVTGKSVYYDTPRTLWSLSHTAIKELYAGNVENALALFRKAIQTQGRNAGSFPISLLNFYYALCIIRYRVKYGQLSATDALNALHQATNFRTDSGNFASRLLIEYVEVATEGALKDVERRTDMVLGYSDNHLNRCFGLLLANFFSVSKGNLDKLCNFQPSIGILMHELSPYMNISTKSKDELAALYGGKPLLANIHRKASWEVLLGEINETVKMPVDVRSRRIVYFLNRLTLSSILEQVEQSPDNWKEGQLLSAKVLCNEGYDSMDVNDSRIAMQLTRKEEWQTDADIIVPNLVGTDRLFYGVEYLPDRILARIVNEDPYIEFSGQGDQIVISSNVKLTPEGTPRKHTVTLESYTYTLVSLNPLQRDILSRLLAKRTLPASAAPSLRKTIDSLKGIIEVRENILSDIDAKAFESDGRLVVRIEPVEREYKMTIYASALPEGLARLVPAVGEEYVYDEDERGQTHCVHRHMEKEEENFQQLVDFADQFQIEFGSYNECNIGEERNLLNLLSFCHHHQDSYMLEWPNGQILKFKGVLTENDIDIDVKSDMNWFAVEGEVRIGGKPMSLDELLKACCNKTYQGFVRIGENEYLQMTETLRRHIAELDAVLTMGERKKNRVPKYLIGALANTLEEMNHHTDSGYRELMLKMKEAYETDIHLPMGLQANLRPYQEEGYRWMKRLDAWGAGACLADDMGLGKTLQALAFMLSKASEGPSLVVAPKSVIPNWVAETQKFAPQMGVIVLNDSHQRKLTVDCAKYYTLVLCTYGVLNTESDLLASKEWNVVCLDEAQQIKNRTTLVSQAAMNLKAKSRIILTGTPLQNHVGELWNLMQFINPGLLGRWNVFRDTYVNATLDETHKEMLKEMTQPFILRRTKEEVLDDLPEKVEGVHYVSLSENELGVYEAMRKQVELKFKKGKTKEERAAARDLDISYFDELMKLRLISCDMHLVYDRWKEQSTKITALMEILETLMDVPENNILVFSQFTSFLARIKPELEKRRWDYLYLDGQTPMKKRQTFVEQFQQGEKRLFLSSLKAGGLGINLTAANYVILLDPWWNPAIENQATDRAHRIGQKRCVSIIRLISEHTIEEKILRLHEKKQQLSDEVLSGTSDSYKLTYEDILDMVAPY